MDNAPTRQPAASGMPIPVVLVLVAAALFAGGFYLSYAQSAWFHQDDFPLIIQYAHALQPQQILDFGNFGRFLSRNAYWHYGVQLFELHAQLFFLLNLFLIAATSLMAYKLVEGRHGAFAGWVAALLYFCLPGTVEAFSWLSNSQHLMGHLFVLVFVHLFTRHGMDGGARRNALTAAGLLLVFLLGMWSNVFMGMVLSLPAWLLAADKAWRRNRWNWVVPVLGLAVFLYFYSRLGGQQTGAYATSFSFATLRTNAAFYFKGDAGAVAWAVVVLAGAAYAGSRGRLFSAWLLLASAVFFLPFAFFVHQRYGTYSVMPHLFFVLGCWCVVCDVLGERRPVAAQYAGAAILAFVLVQSLLLPIRYFGQYPNGKAAREYVEQLRLFDAQNPQVKSYCFRGDKKTVNATGVAAWDMPAEWWHVGFGNAFSLFVNGNKTYALAPDAPGCDATFVFKDRRLEPAPSTPAN